MRCVWFTLLTVGLMGFSALAAAEPAAEPSAATAATAATPTAAPVGWRMNYSGIYETATPPTQWSKTENVLWVVPMKKFSNASVIVVGDKLFTTVEPSTLMCLNKADGKELWSAANDLEAGTLPKAQPSNGYASGTPTSDGKRVYAVFASGVVVCYDLEGKLIWKKVAKLTDFQWGHCVSPLLIDGKLIVELGYITAFNAADGEVVWTSANRAKEFYGSPVAAAVAGKPVVITPCGKILNAADGSAIENNLPKLEYATPLVVGNQVYFLQTDSKAYELPAALDGKPRQLWTAKLKADRYYTSPLFDKDLLYTVHRSSHASVIDAKTGEVVAEKDLGLKRDFYASVTKAGNFLYFTHESGTTLVMKPGKELEAVATNKLEQTRATPVFEGSRMYIRTWKNLYCIGK